MDKSKLNDYCNVPPKVEVPKLQLMNVVDSYKRLIEGGAVEQQFKSSQNSNSNTSKTEHKIHR